MHSWSIWSGTGPGRVFGVLMRGFEAWHDGWRLTLEAETSAVSTQIAAIREQLEGTALEVQHETRQEVDAQTNRVKVGNWYRIAWRGTASVEERRVMREKLEGAGIFAREARAGIGNDEYGVRNRVARQAVATGVGQSDFGF